MRKHLFIPDTQCRPGSKTDHLTAVGNYIVEKRPDVVIHAGDHWDMPSLSSYDKGTRRIEGARYEDDIQAGKDGMTALLTPLLKYNKGRRNKYLPRMVFTLGNHEQRIQRHVDANPALEGKLSYKDLGLLSWEVHDFLRPVCIDGVYYSHYFYNPFTSKPYGGRAFSRLSTLGFSFTQGHQQGRDEAEKPLANGKTIRGLIAGSFYQHDEDYKGPQGNNHWRGCIMKHEVNDGNYCLCEVSLNYLLKRYQ